MLAQPLRRQASLFDHQHQHQYRNTPPPSRTPIQAWVSSYSTPITPAQSEYSFSATYPQPSSADQSGLFDYNTSQNFSNLSIQVETPYDSNQEPELMHSEQAIAATSWNFMNGQLTPTSARTHYRESSLSSIGSAGPASPYNGSTPHPQVLLPQDSETNYDGLPLLDQTSYHTFSKPLTPSSQDNFLVPSYQSNYNLSYNSNSHIAALIAMQRQQQASGDDESMPASDYGHSGRLSVASTHESPATPPVAGEYDDQPRKIEFRSVNSIPKLDRTMSDAYNDELYSPSFTFTSTPSTKMENMSTSHPQSAVFSQMLQVANNQHLSASSRSSLGEQSRDQKTAFREGSPLAPVSNTFNSPQVRFGSAQQIRERQKAENDDRILQQQIQRTSPVQAAPKTISPRDAILDYHGTEEESTMPLFPVQKPSYRMHTHTGRGRGLSDLEDTASQQSYGSMATSRRESSSANSTSSHTMQQGNGFAFAPPSVPGGIRVPQQYPFVPQQSRQPSNVSNVTDRSPEFPSTLSSMESSSSEYRPDNADLKKPTGSNADGGTYTCTYHGCTLRFETPAKLQKHKREGHRQSASLVGGESATTSPQSQAGPHICKRINPSSGKPCNVVFSRPYDLTRHEDTIHNSRKVKTRCPLCKEEKTFSRQDALTRHLKVVHPHYQPPTKNRRGQQ